MKNVIDFILGLLPLIFIVMFAYSIAVSLHLIIRIKDLKRARDKNKKELIIKMISVLVLMLAFSIVMLVVYT